MIPGISIVAPLIIKSIVGHIIEKVKQEAEKREIGADLKEKLHQKIKDICPDWAEDEIIDIVDKVLIALLPALAEKLLANIDTIETQVVAYLEEKVEQIC